MMDECKKYYGTAAENDHKKWKQKIALHAKKTAMLEVSLRKEKLKK